MPSTWRIPLADQQVPDRRAVYLELVRWFDRDHHAQDKPWSWSHRVDGSKAWLEISVLTDDAERWLIECFTRYASRTRKLPGFVPVGSLELVQAVSWAELVRSKERTSWDVQFCSPVTFARGKLLLPSVSPSAVFGSLRRSWQKFAPLEMRAIDLDLSLDPIVISAIEGRSQVERIVIHDRPNEQGTMTPVSLKASGFVGTVQFLVDGSLNKQCANALMRLAPFSGIGSHTHRGFGACNVGMLSIVPKPDLPSPEHSVPEQVLAQQLSE